MKRGRPKGRSSDTRSFGPLGDLIRKNRLEKQLGLADVARACGCSVQFISKIEHGRAPLPWDKVPVLATFLKISQEELQAANLAIRSDFKSFVKLSTGGTSRGRKSASNLMTGSTLAANAVAVSTQDEQIREILARYQAASQANRKKFAKAALKMLNT